MLGSPANSAVASLAFVFLTHEQNSMNASWICNVRVHSVTLSIACRTGMGICPNVSAGVASTPALPGNRLRAASDSALVKDALASASSATSSSSGLGPVLPPDGAPRPRTCRVLGEGVCPRLRAWLAGAAAPRFVASRPSIRPRVLVVASAFASTLLTSPPIFVMSLRTLVMSPRTVLMSAWTRLNATEVASIWSKLSCPESPAAADDAPPS